MRIDESEQSRLESDSTVVMSDFNGTLRFQRHIAIVRVWRPIANVRVWRPIANLRFCNFSGKFWLTTGSLDILWVVTLNISWFLLHIKIDEDNFRYSVMQDSNHNAYSLTYDGFSVLCLRDWNDFVSDSIRTCAVRFQGVDRFSELYSKLRINWTLIWWLTQSLLICIFLAN